MSSQRALCVTFHAELLDKEPVWTAVRRVMDRGGHGMRCTFFVHPAHAMAAGADLSPRLREIAQRGHEIAQHTHYYAYYGITPGGAAKKTSLDPEVVERCLRRDREYLQACGFTPHGFVSGGWAMNADVFPLLEILGFTYDCSDRTFNFRYQNPLAPPALADGRPFRKGSLLEFPTHGPVSWRLPPRGRDMWICYMHDDDLLNLFKRGSLSLLLRRAARNGWACRTVGELALEAVGSEKEAVPA